VIAVDTSALMAVLLDEPQTDRIMDALASADELVISSVTVTEALIVAERRGLGDAMSRLLDRLGMTFIETSPATARRVAATYSRWGRGVHPASLNFCDCFAYDVAQQYACPLLFVGDDFPKTDIRSAL